MYMFKSLAARANPTLTFFILVCIVFILMYNPFACAPVWANPTVNGTFTVPETYTVCVDLPKDQLPAAKVAIEMWDRALHQWRRMVYIEGPIEPCTFTIRNVEVNTTNDPAAIAWTSHVGGGEIFMLNGKYEGDVTGIVLHELGHALGAQHLPGTLMNSAWQHNMYVCPDGPTVAQVAAWNRVNINLLSWCTP